MKPSIFSFALFVCFCSTTQTNRSFAQAQPQVGNEAELGQIPKYHYGKATHFLAKNSTWRIAFADAHTPKALQGKPQTIIKVLARDQSLPNWILVQFDHDLNSSQSPLNVKASPVRKSLRKRRTGSEEQEHSKTVWINLDFAVNLTRVTTGDRTIPAFPNRNSVRVAVDNDLRLTGEWTATLPAGFTHPVTIKKANNGKYALSSPAEVFNGIYELEGTKLVVTTPADDRMTGLTWKLKGNRLELVDEPENRPTGSSYLGTTLKRHSQKNAMEKRQ